MLLSSSQLPRAVRYRVAMLFEMDIYDITSPFRQSHRTWRREEELGIERSENEKNKEAEPKGKG